MIKTKKTPRLFAVILCTALLLSATGCMQFELGIQLHDKDGGATITERLRINKPLLDLAREAKSGQGIEKHLEASAARKRMKEMGQGMTLVSHEITDLPDGSRESLAVYKIPDVENLRVPNPFVQNQPPAPMQRIKFAPCYKSNRNGEVGTISVRFVNAGAKKKESNTKLPPSETPLDRQLYRDLRPIVENLAKGFQIKVTITIPRQPARRRRAAGDMTVTLLSFEHKDKDRNSEPFFQNEEAIMALLQLHLRDSAILNHTKVFPRNADVPVHRGASAPYHSHNLRIRPTKHLYKKYFAGRPKSQGGDQ